MGSLVLIISPFKPLRFASFFKSNSLKLSPSSLPLFRLKPSKRFKKSTVAVNSFNPRNPNSKRGNDGRSPIKPFSYLIPFFQKARGFTAKSSDRMLSGFQETESPQQNVAFRAALMSVTATARVRFSPFVVTLAANPTFISGLCALAIAQSVKVILNFCVERKWDFRLMCASGGMPSSHSALCTALTTSVAICHGVADSLFPVCLGFTLIVMYDAIGVRRHAGMQAEVLNLIVENLFQGHPMSQRKLKELLGHTPSQVFAGALLGVLVAWICCCQLCSIPV
ncbi:hypothetical protein OROMI_017477 [Orobanche minor]